MAKGQVGRPPKYKNKEEIEGLIEEYFKKCEGKILKDENGEVVLIKMEIRLLLVQSLRR